MARRVILRLLSAVALIIVLHLSLLGFKQYLSHQPLAFRFPTLRLNIPQLHNPTKPKNHNVKLCYGKECVQGSWLPRKPAFKSVEDVQKAFAGPQNSKTLQDNNKWTGCRAPRGLTMLGKPKMRFAEEKHKMEAERLVNVTNWVWKPRDGEFTEWDGADMLVRMLKMPGGLIFVGDTVTRGHEDAFRIFLEATGVKLQPTDARINRRKSPHIHAYVLPPSDELTLKLQSLAKVPESRLKRPVFTFISDEMLLNEKDVLAIARRHGAPPKAEWKPSLDGGGVHDWARYLDEATKDLNEPGVDADTVVLLNTGAHWSRNKLYVLPKKESINAEKRALTNIYTEMITQVIKRLSSLKRTSIIYRATSAAHPGCQTHITPYESYGLGFAVEGEHFAQVLKHSKDQQDKVHTLRWDWDEFDVHNMLWSKMIAGEEKKRLLDQGKKGSQKVGTSWSFMDVWGMSLQRPDAHSQAGDCLHWCPPSIYWEWSRYLYHILYLESEAEKQKEKEREKAKELKQ